MASEAQQNEEQILWLCDRACVVCHRKGRCQVHHIDGNHSNHELENLALVCVECHIDTQLSGGFVRHPSPEYVRKAREEHIQAVAAARQAYKGAMVEASIELAYEASRVSRAGERPAGVQAATSPLAAEIHVRQSAPAQPPAPHVAQVLSLRSLGASAAWGFPERAHALAVVSGGLFDAFWFLPFIDSGAWLLSIAPTLRQTLAEHGDQLLWPVGRMLVCVAKQEQGPEAVVASGLLPVLWAGGTDGYLFWAMETIESGDLWEHEAVVPLLAEAAGVWPDKLGDIAFELAKHAKRSARGAQFALRWVAEWLRVIPAEEGEGTTDLMSLRDALADIIEAQPNTVVDAAIQLVDAVVGGEQERLLLDLRHSSGGDLQYEIPLLQVRRVLADKLGDEHQRPKVLNILAELLDSDNAAKRALALDVIKEDPVGLTDLVVGAACDPRNHDRHLSLWMWWLIRQAYADLSDADKHAVTEALLALPDEAAEEGKCGFIKLHALAAIPEKLRSDEVRRAIAALYGRFDDLRDPPYEPHEPGSELQAHAYFVGDEVDEELAALTDNPDALIDRYLVKWETTEEQRESGWSDESTWGLAAALERSPDNILPIAQALAQRGPDLPEPVSCTLVSAVASAIRSCKDFTGQNAYCIATLLDDLLTSEARHDLAAVLADRGDQIAKEDRAAVVALLHRWLTGEAKPTEDDTERMLVQQGWDDAADAGLNTPRGAMAVALVDIAAKAEKEVRRAALDAVMEAAQDPSPLVRAIVARWIGNLGRVVESEWLIEATQHCIEDFSPYVLPSVPVVFRTLDARQIEEFGANVVRVMLVSGDEAAKGAGFLAAMWSLRHPSTSALADELLTSESMAAKKEAVHVFAHNILDDDEATRDKCEHRVREMLEHPSREVREAAIRYLPDAPEQTGAVLDLLRVAANDPEGAALPALDRLLHRHAKRGDKRNPAVVKAIVAGLMDNPSEEMVGQYLLTASHMLAKIYDALRKHGEKELALRLLDTACYHRVPAAADLLDDAETLMEEMGQAPESD